MEDIATRCGCAAIVCVCVWCVTSGLGAAQLALATSMEQFEFACIGASMTEDERVISRSLHHFAHLIRTIEDERERMVSLYSTLLYHTILYYTSE